MKNWKCIFPACFGILLSLSISPAYAQPEDDESPDIEPLTPPKFTPSAPNIEELLVTGSYIKGLSEENLASPMQSISRSDILDIGAFRLEDIANNLTINTGSQNNPDAFTQNFTTGTSNLNLRGLGVASTLVLLNGRRQTYSAFTTDKGENFVDLSSLVPLIAVERLEILKDGAASLYGSDAVAGVANFITRNNFEGIEIEVESISGDSQGDLKLGGIFGTGNDTTHFMAAFSYLDRDGLGTNERRLSTVEDDTSRAGFPGTFLFPFAPVPSQLASDWNTAYNSGSAFTSPLIGNMQVADFFEPLLAALGGTTIEGSRPPAFADPDCSNIADDTTVPPASVGLQSPIGPCQFDFGTFFSLVPNEERVQAYANLTHDLSDSLKFFAEVALADNSAERRNSPSFPITTTPVICGNGVLNSFNLDGTTYTCVGGANPVRVHPNNPYGVDTLFIGRVLGSGADALISHHDSRTTRLATGLSGAFSESWDWSIDVTQSRNEFDLIAKDTLANEFQLALFGLGGRNCSRNASDAGDPDAGCFYFNPFGASLIPGSGDRANSAEIFDYITGTVHIDAKAELHTLSGLATGSLFEMAGGDAGLAVGVQLRDESLDYDYDENSNQENFIFFTGNPDFHGKRSIKSAFSELAMPITEDLDVQLSVRYEDYEDSGESTDPKIAAVWRPTGNIKLRGSIGTSFRAPSLYQQSGEQTTLVEISTPTLGNQFIAVRAKPDPNNQLEPEEANVFNLGAGWTSDEGSLSITADYWSYDYSNVIIQQNPQAVLDAALLGDTQSISQVSSTATGINRITVFYDNASKLETDGLDVTTRYNWSGNSGSLYQLALELTKVLNYDLEDPQAGGIDGLGQRNYTNFATSMPELKANVHFFWGLNQHSVNLYARHTDSYNNDQLDDNRQPLNETIDTHTTFDLQYSYRFESPGFGEGMMLTVGGINVTDEDPPHVSTNGGYDSKVHDPRGALYYLKLNMPF